MNIPSVRTKILFVCIGNSCRSQMAEGFARSLGSDRIEVFSAGSRPTGIVNPMAIEVMREIGIDISKHTSKGIGNIPQEKFDAIVSMGCGDACPQLPARKRLDWQIPDPVGESRELFRTARDRIRSEVIKLLDLLIIPSSDKN